MKTLWLFLKLKLAHRQADRLAQRVKGEVNWNWLLTVLTFAFLLLTCAASPSHESQVSRTWYTADQLYLASSKALTAMHSRAQVCDLWTICQVVSQETLSIPIEDAEARCLAVIFGESVFHPTATHLNRNKTVDHGLMQVNDIHFLARRYHKTSEWQRFCWQRGWTDDPTLKLDIRRNVAFGCHLWRMELRQGKRSYQWAKAARPDQRRFYALLRDKLQQ